MIRKLSKCHFWEWFGRNNEEYLRMNKKSKKEISYWLNELNTHLRAYYKFLNFTLIHAEDGSHGSLTITVRGQERYFKKVDDLVATAPSIPNWEIHALDAPACIDFLMAERHGDKGIDVHEFCFVAGTEEDWYEFIIYHPLYTEDKRWDFERLATDALYNLLGERFFAAEIQRINIDNTSRAPKGSRLIKLEELPDHLKHDRSSWAVDTAGRLKERNNACR